LNGLIVRLEIYKDDMKIKNIWRARKDSNFRPTASYHYGFHRQLEIVCGLDFAFTMRKYCV